MSLIEKIKLLFAIRKPVTDLANGVKEIKKGWKTLGFWATVLGSLISVATAVAGFIPGSLALMITTGLTVAYNLVRSFQNAGTDGVTPIVQSTRFLTLIVGILSAGLLSLKSGGIDPHWVEAAIGILAAVGAACQSLGATTADSQSK
jgi:ABC-type amino acid transport system permease subunit